MLVFSMSVYPSLHPYGTYQHQACQHEVDGALSQGLLPYGELG